VIALLLPIMAHEGLEAFHVAAAASSGFDSPPECANAGVIIYAACASYEWGLTVVSKTTHVDDIEMEEAEEDPEVVVLSAEEARRAFDYQARATLNMSGEEFVRRWEAGEFDEIADTAGHRHIIKLAMLIPWWRAEP